MLKNAHIILAFSLLLTCAGIFGQQSDSTYNILDDHLRSDNFYDSLQIRANKKNWSRELHRLIVRDYTAPDSTQKDEGNNRADYFIGENEKVIRNIYTKQLEVFGPSITDTARTADHWIEKTGNSIHVQTNRRFIENNLVIAEGERIDPNLLADNERILRKISSIQDVRFYAHPVEGSDSVDIEIVTKDVMPFGVSWTIFDVVYGEASIWNNNILGLGHSLQYTAYYNLNREPKYGYQLAYRVNNISNSFTSLRLQHTKKIDLAESSVELKRNFFTPTTRFGGAINLGNVDKTFTLQTIDTSIPNINTKYEYYDGWVGYSNPIEAKRNNKLRSAWFMSVRGQIYTYLSRPDSSENYQYEFFNRNTFLGSTGFTWQGYYKTRLVYGFGNTEDLPYGAMIKFTGGYEVNEFGKRQYYASTFTASQYFKKFGYLSGTLELGGFYKDKIEQGLAQVKILHISPLLAKNRHKFRNFISADFTQGVNRFNNEFILIETQEGLRGIEAQLLKGDKRFYINNELVYYSPHYLYGFRFVFFAYADAAMINSNSKTLVDNPLYIGAGLGVRVRNERLVFNTIQLRLSFFPLSPGIMDANKEYFNFTSYPEYRMEEFANRRPEILDF